MKATLKFDMPDLSSFEEGVQRIVAEEMSKMADKIIVDIGKLWTGWKYKGRPSGHRNVSKKAWHSNVETSQAESVIWLRNYAVDWRAAWYAQKGNAALSSKYANRPYVSIVSRTKGGSPEWLKVMEMIRLAHLPELEKQILQSMAGALQTVPKSTRTPRPSPTSGMTIIS